MVTARQLRDENSLLIREDKPPVVARDAASATATQAARYYESSLQTKSFISAASFKGYQSTKRSGS